jgi:hypothetical protein
MDSSSLDPVEAFLFSLSEHQPTKKISLSTLMNTFSRLAMMQFNKGSLTYEDVQSATRLLITSSSSGDDGSAGGSGLLEISYLELNAYSTLLYESILVPMITASKGPILRMNKEFIGNDEKLLLSFLSVLLSHSSTIPPSKEIQACIEEFRNDVHVFLKKSGNGGGNDGIASTISSVTIPPRVNSREDYGEDGTASISSTHSSSHDKREERDSLTSTVEKKEGAFLELQQPSSYSGGVGGSVAGLGGDYQQQHFSQQHQPGSRLSLQDASPLLSHHKSLVNSLPADSSPFPKPHPSVSSTAAYHNPYTAAVQSYGSPVLGGAMGSGGSGSFPNAYLPSAGTGGQGSQQPSPYHHMNSSSGPPSGNSFRRPPVNKYPSSDGDSVGSGGGDGSGYQPTEIERNESIVRLLAHLRKEGMDLLFPQVVQDKVRKLWCLVFFLYFFLFLFLSGLNSSVRSDSMCRTVSSS